MKTVTITCMFQQVIYGRMRNEVQKMPSKSTRSEWNHISSAHAIMEQRSGSAVKKHLVHSMWGNGEVARQGRMMWTIR